MRIFVCTCAFLNVSVCLYVCTCASILEIDTRIHTHTYVHTHVHTQAFVATLATQFDTHTHTGLGRHASHSNTSYTHTHTQALVATLVTQIHHVHTHTHAGLRRHARQRNRRDSQEGIPHTAPKGARSNPSTDTNDAARVCEGRAGTYLLGVFVS